MTSDTVTIQPITAMVELAVTRAIILDHEQVTDESRPDVWEWQVTQPGAISIHIDAIEDAIRDVLGAPLSHYGLELRLRLDCPGSDGVADAVVVELHPSK